MITGRQIKAARALLNWDAADLAATAKLSRETISNIENNLVQAREGTLVEIASAFNNNGIEFLGSTGVQLKQDTVYTLKGPEGFRKLMDEIYLTACDSSATDGSKPICVSSVDDRLFMKHLGDYMLFHAKRMDDLKNVKVRVLVREQDYFVIPGGKYLDYRWCPRQETGNVPFYVFGDKFAILILDEANGVEIIIISSAQVARVYREQFDLLWQTSKTKPFKHKENKE
jgi:transcriptional regulator with XRE-family HTH domain